MDLDLCQSGLIFRLLVKSSLAKIWGVISGAGLYLVIKEVARENAHREGFQKGKGKLAGFENHVSTMEQVNRQLMSQINTLQSLLQLNISNGAAAGATSVANHAVANHEHEMNQPSVLANFHHDYQPAASTYNQPAASTSSSIFYQEPRPPAKNFYREDRSGGVIDFNPQVENKNYNYAGGAKVASAATQPASAAASQMIKVVGRGADAGVGRGG